MCEAVYLILGPTGATKEYGLCPAGLERAAMPARLDRSTPAISTDSASRSPNRGSGLVPNGVQGFLTQRFSVVSNPIGSADLGSFVLASHADRPVGGTLPSADASATSATMVNEINIPVIDMNRPVTLPHQLASPDHGTYSAGATVLDPTACATPKSDPPAARGQVGRFGTALPSDF